MYFRKVAPSGPRSPVTPPTFSLSSTSVLLETARPTLPLPPQSAQCQDNKDEDLYDDPPPLNE